MKNIVKKILTAAVALTMVCGAFALAACGGEGEEKHEHTFSSEWTYDETNHWHAATCEHKDEKSGVAAHTFSGDTCTVCGYTKEDDSENQGNQGDQGGTETPADENEYIMEAEDVNLDGIVGGDTSATPQGTSLIVEDTTAHGGKYIDYLFRNETFLEFEFTSSKAVDDATIVFSFRGKYKEFTFNNDEVQIFVNPELDDMYLPVDSDARIKYNDITLGLGDPFKEFTIAEDVSLREGTNTVYILINNTDSLVPTASTMNAKAPTVDYLKITTSATLTQVKYSGN